MDHTISLATADRRRSLVFYRDGLGLEAFGPLADDGVPEPLQLRLASSVSLMLIPPGGGRAVSCGASARRRVPGAAPAPPGVEREPDADPHRRVRLGRRRGPRGPTGRQRMRAAVYTPDEDPGQGRYKAALAAGGTSVYEPSQQEWNAFAAQVADPDGHLWMILVRPPAWAH